MIQNNIALTAWEGNQVAPQNIPLLRKSYPLFCGKPITEAALNGMLHSAHSNAFSWKEFVTYVLFQITLNMVSVFNWDYVSVGSGSRWPRTQLTDAYNIPQLV